MKTWFSGCRSTATKAWKRLNGFLMPSGSDSNSVSPNGLWKNRKGAIRQAKKKMFDLGGRWGVVRLGTEYCEVEQTYWKSKGIKPVWVRKDWLWLTGR